MIWTVVFTRRAATHSNFRTAGGIIAAAASAEALLAEKAAGYAIEAAVEFSRSGRENGERSLPKGGRVRK